LTNERIKIDIEIKYSTFTKYYDIVNNHIRRLFEIDTSSFDIDVVNNFISNLYSRGRIDNKGGLSEKYITDIYSVLRAIIEYALDKGYLQRFNFKKVKSFKKDMSVIRVFTSSQQELLVKYLISDIDFCKMGTILAFYSGMRIGEICALKFSDIDFTEGSVRIYKTLQRVKNLDENAESKTKIIITSPKSSKSIRVLPVQGDILKYLFELKRKYNCKDEYYLLTGTSKYIEPRLLEKKFKTYLEECNLENINFHSTRHTFATIAVEKEFDIKTLSEILGHSKVTFTLERYVHSSMKQKRTNIEKLTFPI